MGRNGAVVAAQRRLLEAICRRHVGPGDRYALLDFPDYSNVGDSAIWLGASRLLREITGHGPSYVCTCESFDAADLARACPAGVLFINGGGNLGDLWPKHQRFREMLLARLRERVIVQLPQSIKFHDASGMETFARIVAAHPSFHLYVRDHASHETAQRHFDCPSELAPDSAFALGAQQRAAACRAVVMLLRTDSERLPYDLAALERLPDGEITDWTADSPWLLRAGRIRRQAQRRWAAVDSNRARMAWYDWLATARLRRGLGILSRGKAVITDRLHAHILSTLLDIPHVALDNTYGKVSGYIAAWTKDYPGVLIARSPAEAVEQLGRLEV